MKDSVFNPAMIAPCGMNCGVCIAFLRDKNRCSGCRSRDKSLPRHCSTCQISNCESLKKSASPFCFDCEKFPCARVRQLDARYIKNYRTSLIGNLREIQTNGLENFLINETERYICTNCHQVLSVHRDHCIYCKNEKGER